MKTQAPATERRVLTDHPINLEVRENNIEKIVGYALLFNRNSHDLGGFIERIDPKALDGADVSDVVALFNHDNNFVLGRTPGTLKLSVDELGLKYEIEPADSQNVRDFVLTPIKRGDIKGSSFQFEIDYEGNGSTWEEKDGQVIRTITKFKKIWDVSPVTMPAYPDTIVGMRSLQSFQEFIKKPVPNTYYFDLTLKTI